jgi:predicted component of type VI protein secretion system
MHALIVQSGKHKGKRIPLPEKEVTVGRDEVCYIRLASTEVSRQHCAFKPTSRGLLVRDLGSQNGTLVNHVLIETETLLRPGDEVRVGPMIFLVAGPKPPPQRPSEIDQAIVGWLSESDTATDNVTAFDTTIVKASQLAPPAPPATKVTFETVAEEAKDIIRRHLESLKERDKKKDS